MRKAMRLTRKIHKHAVLLPYIGVRVKERWEVEKGERER